MSLLRGRVLNDKPRCAPSLLAIVERRSMFSQMHLLNLPSQKNLALEEFCMGRISAAVPQRLIKEAGSETKGAVIFEMEMLTVFAAYASWNNMIQGKHAVFIRILDNQATKACLSARMLESFSEES